MEELISRIKKGQSIEHLITWDIVQASLVHELSYLHLAVRHHNRIAALELIRAGANVNVVDSALLTPLHIAAYHSAFFPSIDMLQILISHGGDLDAVSATNDTPRLIMQRNMPIYRQVYSVSQLMRISRYFEEN